MFPRDLLLQVLSRPQLVVCYKAKDLLRTALQSYKQEISWKQGSEHAQIHICITTMQSRTQPFLISCVISGWMSYSGPTGVRVATGSCKSMLLLQGPSPEILQKASYNSSRCR